MERMILLILAAATVLLHLEPSSAVPSNCHHDCRHRRILKLGAGSNHQYTYILRLQQPQGLQYTNPNIFLPHRKAPRWTIHGLWPHYTGDSHHRPRCCNATDASFDVEKIKDVKSEMEKFWLSLTKKVNVKFWTHEWCVHGTCAAGMFTQDDDGPVDTYFSATLELYKKYDMTEILRKHSVVPGNTYQHSNILNAIQSETQAVPELFCHFHDKVQVLIGIDLCFTLSTGHTFIPVDCKTNSKFHCSAGINLHYQL